MADPEKKVVGYFAYHSAAEVICTDGDACVVSGSVGAMKRYLAELDPERASTATVKKTRFGEILRGLELGAAYAFDRESYGRFYPLAVRAGLPVQAADFANQSGPRGRFFTVRFTQL